MAFFAVQKPALTGGPTNNDAARRGLAKKLKTAADYQQTTTVDPEEPDHGARLNAQTNDVDMAREQQIHDIHDDNDAGDSDFDGSAALDDSDEEYDDFTSDENATKPKKRKRCSSPPLDICSETWDISSPVANTDDRSQSNSPEPGTGDIIVNLTVKISRGHRGPVILHLTPENNPSCKQSEKGASKKSICKNLSETIQPASRRAGFLDLPAELRNQVYRLVFVTRNCFTFSHPCDFSRSAALLRTCSQVHNEARSILYSENRFVIERRMSRYGSIWAPEWNELGYHPARVFLKSIGVTNTRLIRHLRLRLQDAVPCMNPGLTDHEERRFVHDASLMSVLRHLGAHAQLRRLELLFHGRRRVDGADELFLAALKRVKADAVVFVRNWPGSASKQTPWVKNMLLATCTRRRKRFCPVPGEDDEDDEDWD